MGFLDDLLKKAGESIKTALSGSANHAAHELDNKIDEAIKNAKYEASLKHKKIKFEKLPQNAEEMKAMSSFDSKNEFAVAAFAVTALLRYASDKKAGKEMLDVLDGPESPANRDLQQMDLQLKDGEYIIRSYFKGAVPENDYTPSTPYTIDVVEYPNSRDIENYVYLYIPSGGADHRRRLQLRKKPSTGEWFIWSYQGLIMDIRVPQSEDKWA
jgi:hypothetical protein